jgi:hypothetical protein
MNVRDRSGRCGVVKWTVNMRLEKEENVIMPEIAREESVLAYINVIFLLIV